MENKETLFSKLKWALYSAKIKLFKPKEKATGENQASARAKERIFIILMLVFPIVQFLIFYVALNFNSILLSFQKYDLENSKYTITGFENFVSVFKDIFVTKELLTAVTNSAIQFVFSMLMLPINVITAYVVFKKVPFSGFLKIMMFMPNLLSSMVFVLNARILLNYGFPIIFNNPDLHLLNKYNSQSFWTVLIFGCWMSFAGGMVVYLSAMSSISKDVMEYGELEPLSSFQELLSIVIPLIFPTIITYIVVTLAGFFINAGHFYSFFGGNATKHMPYDTLGYYFFVQVAGDEVTPSDYPYAAAGGLVFTLIVAPITILVKNLLEKYGPSEE